MNKPFNIRLKVGDKVIVLTGKYKGQTGKILRVHPQENKVTVEGVNIIKRHIKPTRENRVGSIKEITKPIWVSKVAIYEPTLKKASRIGYKLDAKGVKTRVYTSSSKEIK
ncbi:MAG: 50S ribosomal protein L24 [Candidatus Saccharibacteria bacterium]